MSAWWRRPARFSPGQRRLRLREACGDDRRIADFRLRLYRRKTARRSLSLGWCTTLGIDCSGLVQLALEMAGIDAPRDSDQQAELFAQPLPTHWRDMTWRRGDLVFFPWPCRHYDQPRPPHSRQRPRHAGRRRTSGASRDAWHRDHGDRADLGGAFGNSLRGLRSAIFLKGCRKSLRFTASAAIAALGRHSPLRLLARVGGPKRLCPASRQRVARQAQAAGPKKIPARFAQPLA